MYNSMYQTPASRYSTLGLQTSGCRWIYMNGQPIWTCRGGGGERLRYPGVFGFGAAEPAQPMPLPVVNTYNGEKKKEESVVTNGGFDIMQFITDNWIWLAVGVLGVILLPKLLKKR